MQPRHKKLALILALILVPVAGFLSYWFAPYTLFIDKQVNEPAPKDMLILAAGEFRSLAHPTTGNVELISSHHGGPKQLRLLGIHTSNGPDLHVYLSSAGAGQDSSAHAKAEVLDLGPLKGNIGTSYYAIPANADLSKLVTAVVWCKRFGVGFGAAPLAPEPPSP